MKSENERCGIKLSDDLKFWRAERPDEWTMDRFIREADKLEKQLQNISHNSDYAKCLDEIGGYMWIDVKNDLPKNEERVAVLYRYKDSDRLIKYVGEYNPFNGEWRNILNDVEIVYWMQLPYPPPASSNSN